ncbi:putative ribonuclease H-like domain-containing protein [Tanacetum coccineum]
MLNRHKNWLVHKQTACGKDFSNPFMVDNLPKIVGFSTHLASLVKSWLVQDQTVLALASPKANELTIPEQTATGKGTSNPFMAGESTTQSLNTNVMFDSGCSKHMTGNKALLTDYQDIDGGFVAFGGSTRGGKITATKSETEFKNREIDEFCRQKGIKREYSVARTPQQNGVAERKNRTLIEAARTMLADSLLPTVFWAEAVNTACYKELHASDAVRKEFEAQCDSQEKITRASSTNSFNTVSTPVNTTSASRTFSPVGPSFVPFVWSLLAMPMMIMTWNHHILLNAYQEGFRGLISTTLTFTIVSPIPTTRVHTTHPKAQIIGDLKSAVQTRGMAKKNSREHAMISYIQKQSIYKSQRFLETLIYLFSYLNMNHKDISSRLMMTASTLMETNKALTKDDDSEDVDVHLYRFQVQPKVSHLNTVKRIFRYLKGQPKLGLWYPKDSPLILEAFSDSDYAGASLDMKSTTRGCQFLGSRTSTARTSANREVELTGIIDGQAKSITKAYLKRHLKLEDNGGVTTLPNSEIFEQLALMGVDIPLFPTMLTAPELSPSRIKSLPSLSPLHTQVSTPSTSQLPNTQPIPNAEEAVPMPHESPLHSVYSLGCDEGSLSLNKLIDLCTSLSKKVEARRRARIVVLEDEDAPEDSSKQGRKISNINEDPNISLVQDGGMTWFQDADAEIKEKNITTAAKNLVYIRRSSKKKKDKGKGIMTEPKLEKETKKQLEQEEASDPAVLRYHALQNRPYSIAEDQNQSFVPMDSKDKEKGSKKKAGGSRKKTLARKIAGEKQSKEGAKRQKTKYEKEKEELKAYLDLVLREEFAIEIESLGTKYPIVDWKTHVLT